MKIYDYLKEKNIRLDLESQNKEDAIKELGNFMRGSSDIIDHSAFIKDVFERENMSSTAIGKGVALPHARSENVNSFIISFGRKKNGIDFNASDGMPVKLFFMMGTPESEGIQHYLQILAHLTRLLKKDSFIESLIAAGSPSEIINIFKRAED
ncbi:MAG: PTS sugar transporter subunit IIA [Elusimicrobiota bacterium]